MSLTQTPRASGHDHHIAYFQQIREVLNESLASDLDAAAALIIEAFNAGSTVFIAGNGGSAATASHMACDFQKTTLAKNHERIAHRLKAIALSDNVPLMSAWGNDVSYDLVFSQQLENLADAGDLLLVITASGNSPNIIAALESAKKLGVKSIGLLGFSGGKAKNLCDVSVIARSENYGVIEDAHSIFMHTLTAHLRDVVHAHSGI